MKEILDLCLTLYVAQDAEPIPCPEEYLEYVRRVEQKVLRKLFEFMPNLQEVSVIPQKNCIERTEFKTINNLSWPLPRRNSSVFDYPNIESFYSWLIEANLSEAEINVIKKVFSSLTHEHLIARANGADVALYERAEFIA